MSIVSDILAHQLPLQLPSGMFSDDDIAAYRALVRNVPDGGVIAEIGVLLGRSLCAIGPECKRRGITIWAIDSWLPDYGGSPQSIGNYANFLQTLIDWRLVETVGVLKADSLKAAKSFTTKYAAQTSSATTSRHGRGVEAGSESNEPRASSGAGRFRRAERPPGCLRTPRRDTRATILPHRPSWGIGQ